MSKEKLLENLMALDFAAVDLQLYLDTHPGDGQALEAYNDTIEKAGEAREEYERCFGPLCSFRSAAGNAWKWIDEPWPWERRFNFEIAGGREHVDL